jgi:hypothetical protein
MASNKKTIVLGLDYSQFEGGVTEVNRKMGLLDAEFKFASESAKKFGDETNQLSLKQEQLTQKINLQTQKVNLAKEAYDKAMASGKATEATVDKLDKALLTQRTTLEKLKNELSDVDNKIEEASKTSSSFGDNIRSLASTMGLEISPAIEGLASKFDGVDASVGNAILGIGGLITTFASFSFSAANWADDLLQMSSVTGITTDELQKMQYASKFLDVDVDTMTNSITKLTRNMNDARGGSSELDEAFRKLHVRYKDGSDQLLNANDVFYNTIDALGNVKNETERDALAMTLLGKSAKELNPLIEAGSQRLKELGIEAENMGTVMDEKSLDKLGKMKDAMDKLENVGGSLKNKLGLELIPILTGLFEVIGKIPVPVLDTLIVLGSTITTIVLLVKAVKSVTDTASSIKGFFSGLNPEALKTTFIIVGVVASLIALGTVLSVIMGRSKDIQNSMASIGNSVGQVTGAVTEAQNKATNAVSNSNVVLQRSEKYGNSYYAPANTTGRNYASGTDYFPGGETWINDGGRPEKAVLPGGTKISFPGDDSGGNIYIQNMTIPASDLDEMQKVIKVFNEIRQKSRQGMVR